jgi:TP901 family phage tail tape measure protein
MFNLGDVILRVVADLTGFDKQLQQQASASGDKAGKTLGQRIGGQLKTISGAAGGAFLVGATENAAKFEDQLRTIQTVAPNLNLDKARDDILALSRDTGKSTDDLTAGFYDLVSAGVSVDDAMGVLRDSAKFATGALGSTGEAVDLVTSVLNAYDMKASESAHVTDVFAKAVADGKVTAAELGQSIAQIAPIAASAGISIEEVSAGFAALTAKGVPAAQAATQMRAAIAALLTPNTQLNDIQAQTGINFQKLAKAQGLAVALNELRKATKGNDDAFAKSLGSIEAYQFALATTGENAQGFSDEIIAVTNAQGLAQEQYDIKSKSAVEQGKRLVAQVQSFLITVGTPFISTIGPAVFALNQLGGAFGANGILAKAFGATIGVVLTKAVSALGPAVSLAWEKLLTNAVVHVQLPAQLLLTRLQNTVLDVFSIIGNSSAGIFVKNFLANSALGQLAVKAAGIIGPIAIAATVVFVGGQIAQGVQDQNEKDLQAKLTAALNDASAGAVADARDYLDKLERGARASHNDSWLNIILGQKQAFNQAVAGRAKDAAQFAADQGEKAAAEAGRVTAGGFAAGLVKELPAQAPVVSKAVSDILAKSRTESERDARASGKQTAVSLAEGMQQGKEAVSAAWHSFLDILKNAETPTHERARLLGELASDSLIHGLKSKDPYVAAQAQITKNLILDRLAELKTNTKDIGKKGMEELRKAMKSKDKDIAAAAKAIYNAATGTGKGVGPADLPAAGKGFGEGLVKNLAAGMTNNASQNALIAAAKKITGIAKNYMQLGSPAKEGPWSEKGGPEGWGARFSYFLSKGMASGTTGVTAAASGLASAAIPAPAAASLAYRAPGTFYASSGMPHGEAMGGHTGDTIVNVKVDGLMKADDPLALAQRLQRFASTGVFSPQPVVKPGV